MIVGPLLVAAVALSAEPQRSRYLEDYSSYQAPECRRDFWCRLKRIPLSDEAVVSLGGQLRLRWERFANERLGAIPTDDSGQLLLRAYAHADVHASARWRLFTQLRSATVVDRAAEPSPLDRDALDVHQLFVQFRHEVAGGNLTLRLGRQEVTRDFRLVSIRDWPNIRLAFDGALVSWTSGMITTDVYGALPVGSEDGAFDDFIPKPQQVVYGLHATLHPKTVVEGLSLFFVGFYDESSRFITQVQGAERRESIGAHIWFRLGVFSGGVEAILQAGRAEELSVLAWLLASDVALELSLGLGILRWRMGLEVGSGDDDPSDGTLGSFNAFYPNNRYYGGTAVVGAFSNSIHLRNSVEYILSPFRAVVELEQYWRESTADVVYGPSGFPSIVVPQTEESFVGHQIDVRCVLKAGIHAEVVFRFAHFFAGDYAEQRDQVRDTTYGGMQITFRL